MNSCTCNHLLPNPSKTKGSIELVLWHRAIRLEIITLFNLFRSSYQADSIQEAPAGRWKRRKVTGSQYQCWISLDLSLISYVIFSLLLQLRSVHIDVFHGGVVCVPKRLTLACLRWNARYDHLTGLYACLAHCGNVADQTYRFYHKAIQAMCNKDQRTRCLGSSA